MDWTWRNPVKVVFGVGEINRLASLIEQSRLVLVTTPGFRRRGVVDLVSQILGKRLVAVIDDVQPNPDIGAVDRQGLMIRDLAPEAIVALGGGSCIDTAKGLARLLGEDDNWSLTAHLRDDLPAYSGCALPVIAIPTTAGTGAEVTPFGTIWDMERGRKYSVTGDDLYPELAVLDPELTLNLPEEVTTSAGLDAISHALESTWNRNANPVTLAFSTKSLQLALEALPNLRAKPTNMALRSQMMEASLLAGYAISHTRTALAHSLSYPLTTAFNLPHGFACSFMLPALMRFNAEADDGRMQELAMAIGYPNIMTLANRLEDIFKKVALADFIKAYINENNDAMVYVDDMLTSGRAKNNWRDASLDEIKEILRSSF